MRNKQQGFIDSTTAGILTLMLIAMIGVCGWAFIEFILWLLSFITIGFGES